MISFSLPHPPSPSSPSITLPSRRGEYVESRQHLFAHRSDTTIKDVMNEPRSDRIIIALDLDAFYVSASRKRDPSLNGLPVGIKQKGILATVSYEARSKGVKKLATIRDGMAQCPEMLLVNGEDLSYFRKISMQVFKLVSSMIWHGSVEKLGMDELFCDCTEMIESQMKDLEAGAPEELDSACAPLGYILPNETEREVTNQSGQFHHLQRLNRKLFLATHLAHHIRSRVVEEIGITSSAGIATSKLIAKLVGNTHKPNHQTVFAPLTQEQASIDTRLFLDPYPLRSLNGFGSVIVEKLCTAACKSIGQAEKDFPSSQLTVALARQIFDWKALNDIFGERLGTRLSNLLQGQDDEPVIQAPEYPAQISIEDTYRSLQGKAVLEQIFILSQSLLRRLETELIAQDVEHGNGIKGQALSTTKYECIEKPVIIEQGTVTPFKVRDYKEKEDESHPPSQRLAWKRYPLSVRLSIRQGWDNRVSRQGKMPVEVFDLTLSRQDRAKILANGLETTLKAIFASEGDKGKGLNLINIAALDLSPHRPAQAIGGFFRSEVKVREEPSSSSSSWQTQNNIIDVAFLKELPFELRVEIAKEYNITLEDDQFPSETLQCEQCGQLQSTWLQHDHLRWPESGLPPNRMDAVDWVLETDDEEEILQHE